MHHCQHALLLIVSLLLWLPTTSIGQDATESVLWMEGEIGVNYTGTTVRDNLTIYRFAIPQITGIRINLASSDATRINQLLAVYREPLTIIASQLPNIIGSHTYYETGRTLCPVSMDLEAGENITISVELSSHRPVNFAFTALQIDDFVLSVDTTVSSVASPSEPVVHVFEFTKDDSVVVWVDSDSSSCMTISIQKAECPIFDQDNNIRSGGMFQTMTKSGSITVERRFFEKFYIVFVVSPDDEDCSVGDGGFTAYQQKSTLWKYMQSTHSNMPDNLKEKRFNITLRRPLYTKTYIFHILSTIVACGVVIIIFHRLSYFHLSDMKVKWQDEKDELIAEDQRIRDAREAAERNGNAPPASGAQNVLQNIADCRRVGAEREAGEYDSAAPPADVQGELADVDEGERAELEEADNTNPSSEDRPLLEAANPTRVFPPPRPLTLKDMTKMTYEARNEMYNRYLFTAIMVAVIYCVPAQQFLLKFQFDIRSNGNQDICWYNFRCARPFFFFYAFNNIISNIGYIAFGTLLIVLTWSRQNAMEKFWKDKPLNLKDSLTGTRRCIPRDLKRVEESEDLKDYGISQHGGFMYAIGIAIIMEGVLSASYHFCPSPTTYQFDTSFMYIEATLGLLKLYSHRHPEDFARSHVAFTFAAFSIFVTMLGVYLNSFFFWCIFSFIYEVVVAFVAWHIGKDINDNYNRRNPPDEQGRMRPLGRARIIMVVFVGVGVLVNLVPVAYGLIFHPDDFPSHFLYPLVGNLLLYIVYYVIMKIAHGEVKKRFWTHWKELLFLFFSLMWIPAGYFFLNHVSDWGRSPAHSRELNQDCYADYYDNHDLWHFCSSIALFMSFSFLHVVDDGIMLKRRDEIAVF